VGKIVFSGLRGTPKREHVGFAAVFGSWWLAGEWLSKMQNYQIAIKELFLIVLSLEIFALKTMLYVKAAITKRRTKRIKTVSLHVCLLIISTTACCWNKT
jgi:hypothetical protein